MLHVFFYKNAVKQLQKIKKKSENDFSRIEKDIDLLSQYPDIQTLWIKKLKGEYTDCFCLKTGAFRIKFVFEGNNVYVMDIKNRKDAYR